MSRRSSFVWLAVMAGLFMAVQPQPTSAATIVIDANDGTNYGAVLDGVPFGAPFDGTPDQGGFTLSVAYKTGVTEMRSIIEFPLTSLSGYTAGDIVSATLTFNVDDVIPLIAPPPFNFDGTAASSIFLWAWAGNGTIDVADFNNVIGAPTGMVVTGPDNSITDATLTASGPLQFNVNLTAAVQARLTAASTHMGVTLATQDSPTGTSINDLGNGDAGPAGVNGAIMPFLTVVTAEPAPPTFSDDALACQKALAGNTRKFTAEAHKLLVACMDRVLKDVADGDGAANATEYCAARLDPASVEPSKLTKARNKAATKIADKCPNTLAPIAINSPCNGSAATMTDIIACALHDASTHVQEIIRSDYADACAIITAVTFDTEYPTICVAF